MPVDQSTTTKIACDNPNCPGPPDYISAEDFKGWILVTHEVYGLPSQSNVFCSPRCTEAMEPILSESIEADAQRQREAEEAAAVPEQQMPVNDGEPQAEEQQS